jgi:o-succinylbenzoate synthase
MRIDRITLYQVGMPLVYPFRTAYGDDDRIESVIVHLVSGDHEGWGESAPWAAPGYSPEWATGAFLLTRDWLAPRLLGQEVDSGTSLQALLGGFKGNHFAKAALDVAWWDLAASAAGLPLWEYIGGRGPTIDVGADLGVMESVEALLAEIGQVVANGFRRLKLKYRRGWDLPMVRAVRDAYPDLTMHIDCNASYTLADLPMFCALDQLGLAMIEQPLGYDDLVDHASLQREIRTPICLDESITSVDRVRKALAIGACGYVNIKPGRVGGLTNAIAIHDICHAQGVPCWVGGMLESALGQGVSVALATLPGFTYPADIFPSQRFYAPDLSEPEIVLSGHSAQDGTQYTAPGVAGVGFRPHPRRLREQTIRQATLEMPLG